MMLFLEITKLLAKKKLRFKKMNQLKRNINTKKSSRMTWRRIKHSNHRQHIWRWLGDAHNSLIPNSSFSCERGCVLKHTPGLSSGGTPCWDSNEWDAQCGASCCWFKLAANFTLKLIPSAATVNILFLCGVKILHTDMIADHFAPDIKIGAKHKIFSS